MFPALLAVWLGASPPALSPAPPGDFPYPIRMDRLPNGMTVARVHYPTPGLVTYHTAMTVGSRNEVEAGHTGFAHFFEHVMFRGTPTFPAERRQRELISRYGLSDNASTSTDWTIYRLTGPTEALPEIIRTEADRFQHLAYEKPAFQTEARAVLGEYNKSISNPMTQLYETLMKTASTRHTYRHTPLGFREDILAMPEQYDYSVRFFQRFYRPDRATVIVVGDFDDDRVMAQIREQYASWTGKAERPAITPEPPQTAERTAHIDWPTPVLPRLLWGWRVPKASLTTADDGVQLVLGSYLFGASSPLYRKLVLEQQWVESIEFEAGVNADPGLFILAVAVKTQEHVDDVRAAADAAIQELANGKVDPARIDEVKSAIRYGALMGLDTTEAVASLLSRSVGTYGTPDGVSAQLRHVREVKPADLVRFARQYLTSKQRTLVTLTHSPQAAEAKKP